MASKITCTIFLVLLVSIAKAQELDGIPQDGDAEALLQQYQLEGKRELSNALDIIDQAEKQLAVKSENEVTKAEIQMKTAAESWKNQLTAIKNEAKAANVNIDVCLGGKETVINNLSEGFSELLRSGCNAFIEQGVEWGNYTMNQLETMVANRAARFKEGIDNCKSTTSPTDCLEEVAATIKRETLALPSIVGSQARSGSTHIVSFIPRIQSFTTDEVLKRKTKGNYMTNEIVKCAESIIHK